MEIYRVTYQDASGKEPELIEADEFFEEDGNIIEFFRDTAVGAEKVATISAADIKRIEPVDLSRFDLRGKFKVSYAKPTGGDEETVEADEYKHEGSWVDFIRNTAVGERKVLRLRSADVNRIDELGG